MKIKCRAKKSAYCYDGRECRSIYGEDTMAGDGLWNGETVICDPCYLVGGQPSIHVRDVRSHDQVIKHVDKELGL